MITEFESFKISGDTLIYSDPYLYEDSLVLKKAKIKFITNDQMTLDYIRNDEHWIFFRLNDKISDIDDDKKLMIDTQKRAEKYRCIDKRPIDEKAKDSLDRRIDFQF